LAQSAETGQLVNTFQPFHVYNFSMSNVLTLYRLQQVDSRLSQIDSRLQAIQFTLEHDAELQAARERQEQAESAVRTAEKALKEAEFNSQAQRIKLEQIEASLYGGRIQNPKELRDLQADVVSLKRRLLELEDIQLDAMMTSESTREAQQQARLDFNRVQGQAVSKNTTLFTERDTLKKERERFMAQRQAIVPAIDKPTLALYDDLRQRHRGVAVAEVSDNSCEACGSSLTPGHAQSVRTSSQLVHCPMCGRILYSN
jgi:predicted  nucleic acid-binding Zn-ribbon protein